LEKLGITDVHMSVLDKKKLVTDYMQKNNLVPEQVFIWVMTCLIYPQCFLLVCHAALLMRQMK
jgi:hypothetical protein